MNRSSRPEVFCEKGVLRNFAKFTGKHLCQSLFLKKLQALRALFKKETLAQVFSCEFFEFSFLTEHLWWLLLFWTVKWPGDCHFFFFLNFYRKFYWNLSSSSEDIKIFFFSLTHLPMYPFSTPLQTSENLSR